MRHLITPMDLSVEETMNILDLAERISIGPQLYKHVADGRQLAISLNIRCNIFPICNVVNSSGCKCACIAYVFAEPFSLFPAPVKKCRI
jgi:hypothetical protein